MPTLTLTDRAVRALRAGSTQSDYWDANLPGFGVRVSAQGRKTWQLRYRTNGHQRRLKIGSYPNVGLAKARAAARSALGRVADGEDPAAAKHVEHQGGTFRQLAAVYMARHARLRKRTWRDDERILNVELLPVLGTSRAKAVTRTQVRELVEAIADRGAPIMANRTLALVRKVFNVGIDQEFDGLEGNPCARLTPPGVEQRRDRVLSVDEIKRVWAAFEQEPVLPAALVRLRLLTAQRGGEIRGMLWDELDLDAGWWTVPSTRSKNKLPHRVPLSPPAIEILASLPKTSSRWVFPSPNVEDQPIKNLTRGMKRIRARSGVDFRGHDLRRTAASLMASSGVSRTVIGKILNHSEPGVTAVYDRHSYDAEKRAALDAWGHRVEQIVADTDGADATAKG